MTFSAGTGVPTVSATIADLVARASTLADRSARTLLGIVGAPGAGKSTVCGALVAALKDRAVLVGMDGFHLDDEVLSALGRHQRKGAPDTFDVPGYITLLQRLRDAREDVTYAPRFDRALELSVGGAVAVPHLVPLVITEGNYLLHDQDGWGGVRPLLDEVWFLDVTLEERMRRLVARRVSYGEREDQAHDWVSGVDTTNGVVVMQRRHSADLIVHIVG